ncbi:VanZ family protein [Aquabacterium sp. J223]|uniref:VanZ family protein n=1 Tax=Aquabacterium sp. J223 TaxID=2898431 RepID=UPI0021ADF9DD|nr:VanZ family protein [Aquabacterium sp. J223]UUX95998.1 VanZ family protein [Aquabacterium sp. J223]
MPAPGAATGPDAATAHRSASLPMALAAAALIAYASLYPLTGWTGRPGTPWAELLALPWPTRRIPFDVWANLLGYAPLGALLAAGVLRRAGQGPAAVLLATLMAAALSYALEVVQHFLPQRVPSSLDWTLNTAGAAAGGALARLVQALGLGDRWAAWRDRWFVRASVGARVLLMLWPLALLSPTPLPLGLGQIDQPLRELATAAFAGTPWEEDVLDWLQPAFAEPAAPLSPAAEWLAIVLGLLTPCLLAHSAMRPGARRLLMVALLTTTGFAMTTLSTALNFGPAHALAWITPATVPALAAAAALAVALAWTGRRLAAALALLCAAGLIALTSQAPADAYFAQSLQAWQQGRFIRFHGLTRWIAWAWPCVALVWLLVRLGARDPDRGR